MSTATAARYSELNLKKTLTYSLLLHVFLTIAMLASAYLQHRGAQWGGPPGGGSGAVTVNMVGNLPGIPLPAPAVVTPNRVVDTTKGLYKAEPIPKAPPPRDAEKIPEFKKEKQPKTIERPSRVLEDKTPPPPNAVPFGQGGAPTLPYSSFSMTGGTQGSIGMQGPGGADFGARYSWYVTAVKRRISENWLVSTVDSSVRIAPRATVTFTIQRNGAISNIRVTQSSGNLSVDNSAQRAVLGSSPLPPLPNDYGASSVNVEFFFDFKR
ncbi:MAG: TonB family protein [Acidobacteriia bacterium]|nr:TonB family protein [Terriglobia bacterium]